MNAKRLMHAAAILAFSVFHVCGSYAAEMDYSDPESQGVSSRDILNWIEDCETNFNAVGTVGSLHGFVIVRHGKVIAEGSWKPFDTLEKTHALFSHSKSFTSTAVGFLVEEGRLGLDERVVEIFPDRLPDQVSDNLKALRVRDLLTMTAGADKDHVIAKGKCSDWVRAFFAKEFNRKPGTRFKYDSDATYMLAAIVEKRSGEKLMDYLDKRLFRKIGITSAWSTHCPRSTACGGWGMNMTTRDIARFGLCCLQGGRWGGESVIPQQWVQLATARHTLSGWRNISVSALGNGSDWEQGYGFQFWRCLGNGYRADGAGGQLTLVFPEADMVVSINAGLNNMGKEIALVRKHLVDKAQEKALPPDPSACAELKRKIASLEIPVVKGTLEGVEKYLGKDVAIRKNKRGITGVRLEKGSRGADLRLLFRARHWNSDFPVGVGRWQGGTVFVDNENHEWLGALIGSQSIKTSGAVQSDGSFRLRGYLTGTTAFIELKFFMKDGKVEVDGRLWGLGGCTFTGTETGWMRDVPPLGDAADTLAFFTENEFGKRPVEKPDSLSFKVTGSNLCHDGKVLHKEVRISCRGPHAPFTFTVHSYEPVDGGPHPVFVAMNFPSRLKRESFDPFSAAPNPTCWPIKDITSRGFATVGFTYTDVVEDDAAKCFDSGLFKAFGPKERKSGDWGALSAWAWAASRCADWVETQKTLDSRRLAVIGHSRLGKTALWAGVTDKRFVLTCINDSGTSGAKLNRMPMPFSESIADICRNFPHWFSPAYTRFAEDNGMTMKYDQHNLVALIAPRRVAIGSGSLDFWAGPAAEEATARLAAEAWEKLGLKGLGGNVFYHVRKGIHDITPEDWSHYMDAFPSK